MTEADTDGLGSPTASRTRVIGTEPALPIVHDPARGATAVMYVLPSVDWNAVNCALCT